MQATARSYVDEEEVNGGGGRPHSSDKAEATVEERRSKSIFSEIQVDDPTPDYPRRGGESCTTSPS